MSKSESNIPVESPPSYSSYQHACLTFALTDRLRLCRFPPEIISVVRNIINTTWSRGLQKEKQELDYYEFKVRGNPWTYSEDEFAEARVMMLHVLSTLYSHGWHLVTSNDFCRLIEDRHSFIFRLDVRPPPATFFALSRYNLDKLLLICVPPELIQAVRNILGHDNIQREKWLDDKQTCYQLKIRGNLWSLDEINQTRMRMLTLLDCFTSMGCQLHTGIFMIGATESNEADTWIFRRTIQ